MSLRMDCSSHSTCSFNKGSSRGIMVDKVAEDHDASFVSCSSSDSVVSDDSDFFEEEEEGEVASSDSSSTPTSPPSSPTGKLAHGPLQDMSSLLQQLPFKRGLSKHYNGKSQSFTSLAKVNSLEDLAKPENPYNKRLKSCKSYGGLVESYRSSQAHRSATSSRLIAKKSSRGSFSAIITAAAGGGITRNASFFVGINNRPPVPPPHRSTSTTSFVTHSPPFICLT